MSQKNQNPSDQSDRKRFETQAAKPRTGLIAEFWEFVRANKKWWMIPIVVTLLVLSGVILLGGTGLAPFIYTLF